MQLNLKNPSIKRILSELKEFQKDPSTEYTAHHLEDNLFEWHFTIRGPRGTEFEGGIYHGRILLPSEYPLKPPHIILLTPNGRFQTNKKICLSVSAHHPETWQPSWSIRTVLIALISFMPTPGEGAIGSLDYKPDERKRLAAISKSWMCGKCGKPNNELLSEQSAASSSSTSANASNITPSEICFKVETTPENSTTPVTSKPSSPSDQPSPSPVQSSPSSPLQKSPENNQPPSASPPRNEVHQNVAQNNNSYLLDLLIISLFILLVAMLYNR